MRSTSPSRSFLTALLALSAAGSSVFAAPYYWGSTTYADNFATASNWFTSAAGTTPASAAPNSLDDDVFFNTTAANTTGGTVSIGSSFSVKSLTFNTSGATVLSQSGNQNMNLGSGGVTMATASGAVNFGTSANTLSTRIAATQTWTNNATAATSDLTVRNLTTATGSGPVSLTLNAAGAGDIFFTFNINDSVSDTLALVVDSTGTGLVTVNGAANTYRGGTTIKQGTLSAFGVLGSGAVQLGDTTGSGSATLNVRIATFTNNITVSAGSSGTKTLTTNTGSTAVLSGTLTLNDNLAFTASTAGTFNGAISGTGDFVKGGNAALTFGAANTFSGDLTLNAGAFTLAETTGSLTFYLGANGVTNQVNGSTTGAVAFNGTFNINTDAAVLANGNTWTLVSLTATAETYGASFALTGFNDNDADNIWTNNNGFSFNELTGVLSYSAVPEPSTFALLGGLATLVFASTRRRQTRA